VIPQIRAKKSGNRITTRKEMEKGMAMAQIGQKNRATASRPVPSNLVRRFYSSFFVVPGTLNSSISARHHLTQCRRA
jgi:hypothetical protein